MSYCVDLVSEDSFYENITLGITKVLESDPRICNVQVERRMPCDRVSILNWEQRHSVPLPEDLRNFYASTDGFQLTWHYKYSADEILPVGSIRVNTLSELNFSSSLKELLDFSLVRQRTGPRPVLNTKSKVLELDTVNTIGKVCLVHTGGSWSIWLATREGAWGWLADTFTQYFRMCLVHLGLPGWQATFANVPLIPWAQVHLAIKSALPPELPQQLFLLLAPGLLDEAEPAASDAPGDGLNHIDPDVFKAAARHKTQGRQGNP